MTTEIKSLPRSAMQAARAARAAQAPPATRAGAITTTGLTKRYGARVALDGVDLTVYRGDVFGLLGPNGTGKSTLLGLLLGLLTPTAGRRAIAGYDLATQPARALRQVGATIEAPAFYPYLSAWDNLRVLGGLRGPLPRERIADALRAVDLADRAHDRYHTYSLGMKQRLAIALALLHDPEILLLDEPTNGLDPRGIVDIRELIERLAARGKTVVLCSHLLSEVEQVCTRVAILRAGRVVAQGPMAEIAGRGDLEATFLELTEGTKGEGS